MATPRRYDCHAEGCAFVLRAPKYGGCRRTWEGCSAVFLVVTVLEGVILVHVLLPFVHRLLFVLVLMLEWYLRMQDVFVSNSSRLSHSF